MNSCQILTNYGHLLEPHRSPAIEHMLKTYRLPGESDALLKSWYGPAKGGTHIKHYNDGEMLRASDAPGYYKAEIVGKQRGTIVPNPVFVIGTLKQPVLAEAAKYLRASNVPSELRISGRSIMHAYERRPEVVESIIGNLETMFAGNIIVLPNHQDKSKVLFVCKTIKTNSGKNYVSAVEVGVDRGALYIVSFMTMPDRTLRQAVELGANWQEGQQPPLGDSPHPIAPFDAHAEADFVDVLPVGDGTIPKHPGKATKSFPDQFDLLKAHIADLVS